MPDLSASLALLTSPAILFFFLGAAAALARSDLSIPEPVAKVLSLYLMLCIGFKGGVEARAAGLQGDFLTAAAIGIVLSALMPILALAILRRTTRLDRPTLCALAATYGQRDATNTPRIAEVMIAGHGQTRRDVSAGARCHDHEVGHHALPPRINWRFSMSTRSTMAMADRFSSKADPP